MEFNELKSSISEALKNLDRNKFLTSLEEQFPSRKPLCKEIQTAERAKAEGNRLYKDLSNHDTPLHYQILHLYNESIAYAPIGSEELANAYSNKSALLKCMRKYSECISEIDQGIKISQSMPLRIKLLCRKSECLTALGSCDNTRCLEKARFFLSKLENTDEKLKKMLTKLIKKTQQIIDEGKLDTPKKNKRKMEALIELARAEKRSIWDSVRFEYSKKYGRHLVANRDFEPGDILYVEKSYSSYLDDSRVHMYCSLCFEYLYTIVACDHCPLRAFCSEKCKNDAWNEYHEMECSVLCHMKTGSPLLPDVSNVSCFLVTIFFKALREAGSISQMKAELKSLDDSDDDLHRGLTPDGKFSSYKSLYSLSVWNTTEDQRQFSLTCATLALMCIAKHSQAFGSTYDVHKMKKLRKNDDAIFIGAFLFKISFYIATRSLNAQLIDPANDKILTSEDVKKAFRTRFEADQRTSTDASILTTSMLISFGCVPNVQTCAAFGNKSIQYALQPIKSGSQLFHSANSSSIFDLAPKNLRQEIHQELYNCACECKACTDDWPRIFAGLSSNISLASMMPNNNDSKIVDRFMFELNSVMRDWRDNSHKQNYPSIKQVSKLKGVVGDVCKEISMPSLLVIKAVGFMRFMFLMFFNPSEVNSRHGGLEIKALALKM